MRRLLTINGQRALCGHVCASCLIAFDLDGTLAPICDEPAKVQLISSTRALLAQVAARFPCVVISGRARQDVCERLAGIPLREVFGNHGVEPWFASNLDLELLQRWLSCLTRDLHGLPGVHIENKVYSLSIHYRHSPEPRRAQRAIRAATAKLPGVRIVGGKMVCNIAPTGAAHKGTALTVAMRRFDCDRALYVGDDDTDEDVFAFSDPQQVMGVRVGFRRSSQAAYWLHRQTQIDLLLTALLRLEQPPST